MRTLPFARFAAVITFVFMVITLISGTFQTYLLLSLILFEIMVIQFIVFVKRAMRKK